MVWTWLWELESENCGRHEQYKSYSAIFRENTPSHYKPIRRNIRWSNCIFSHASADPIAVVQVDLAAGTGTETFKNTASHSHQSPHKSRSITKYTNYIQNISALMQTSSHHQWWKYRLQRLLATAFSWEQQEKCVSIDDVTIELRQVHPCDTKYWKWNNWISYEIVFCGPWLLLR